MLSAPSSSARRPASIRPNRVMLSVIGTAASMPARKVVSVSVWLSHRAGNPPPVSVNPSMLVWTTVALTYGENSALPRLKALSQSSRRRAARVWESMSSATEKTWVPALR